MCFLVFQPKRNDRPAFWTKGYSCDCLRIWVWYRDVNKQSSKPKIYMYYVIAYSTTGNQFSKHVNTIHKPFSRLKKSLGDGKKFSQTRIGIQILNRNPNGCLFSHTLEVRLFVIHSRLYFSKKAIAGLH